LDYGPPAPGAPLLGVGSAELQTGPGGGDGEAKIDSSALNGDSLGALTSLSYSAYDVTNNGQQFPYLKLYVTWDVGQTQESDALYFEPPYQTPNTGSPDPDLPNQATQADTWQTWNALAGGWYDDDGKCNPGTSEAPSKQGVCSLEDLVSLLGVASINDITIDGTIAPDGDGLSLRVGGSEPADDYDAYVDNVTLGVSGTDTTYDFEPVVSASTPEPGTIALCGTGLLLLAAARRRNVWGGR